MVDGGFSMIPQYRDGAFKGTLDAAVAKATYVWCDDRATIARVAQTVGVATAWRAEIAIGPVGAMAVATNCGREHPNCVCAFGKNMARIFFAFNKRLRWGLESPLLQLRQKHGWHCHFHHNREIGK
jgi:hypothetical protein